jgi:hypothetical protein
MDTIKAIVKSGRVELSVPSDWPDGTEVIVRPVMREQTFGIREEDWPQTDDARAEWLRWYDSLEPLTFTAAEQEAWTAARRDQKKFEHAIFDRHGDELRKIWE